MKSLAILLPLAEIQCSRNGKKLPHNTITPFALLPFDHTHPPSFPGATLQCQVISVSPKLVLIYPIPLSHISKPFQQLTPKTQELADLTNSPIPGITVTLPNDNDIHVWHILMHGPEKSPFVVMLPPHPPPPPLSLFFFTLSHWLSLRQFPPPPPSLPKKNPPNLPSPPRAANSTSPSPFHPTTPSNPPPSPSRPKSTTRTSQTTTRAACVSASCVRSNGSRRAR